MMADDPFNGWTKLGLGDQVAAGLAKPGPLAGWVKSSSSTENAQAIREGLNPNPKPQIGTPLPAPWGLPNFPPAPIGMAVPGPGRALGPVARPIIGKVLGSLTGQMGAQGAASGLETAMSGGSAGDVGKSAGISAGLTGALGLPFTAAGLAAKSASAKRLIGAEATQHAEAVAAHEDKVATALTDHFKKAVPAWKGYPSGWKGVEEMVVGKGQSDLSEMFQKGIQGKRIQLDPRDARALGLQDMRGSTDKTVQTVEVSAEDANRLKAALRKRDPVAYQRVDNAIVNAMEPGVRKAYAEGQAMIGFVDKSGAIREGKLDPQKLVDGMYKVNTINELRRRGVGNATKGVFQAARGGPLAPRTPQELGIKTSPVTAPALGGALGHAAGFGIGGMLGHPWMGSMVGGPIGAAAGKAAFPHGIVTQAPLSPTAQNLLALPPQQIAQAIQLYLRSHGQP